MGEMPEADVRKFLLDIPPGTLTLLTDVALGEWWGPELPNLELHCETCGGTRVFKTGQKMYGQTSTLSQFVMYTCRNCAERTKTYALRMFKGATGAIGLKFGEAPAFGPPTPGRLLTLLRDDIDLFSKGRRAESQSMGIGAFAYYRRLVDHQWKKLVGEILRVAHRDDRHPEIVAALESALREREFGLAVEKIKDAIPDELRLKGGHNPLTLLYGSLSKGLHERTDEECLEDAHAIRVVLVQLIERVAAALEKSDELDAAVGRLLGNKPQDAPPTDAPA